MRQGLHNLSLLDTQPKDDREEETSYCHNEIEIFRRTRAFLVKKWKRRRKLSLLVPGGTRGNKIDFFWSIFRGLKENVTLSEGSLCPPKALTSQGI